MKFRPEYTAALTNGQIVRGRVTIDLNCQTGTQALDLARARCRTYHGSDVMTIDLRFDEFAW